MGMFHGARRLGRHQDDEIWVGADSVRMQTDRKRAGSMPFSGIAAFALALTQTLTGCGGGGGGGDGG